MTDKTIDHRLAWLAGIIDGEGWIGFRLEPMKSPPSHANRITRRFVGTGWHVAVANTDPAMLNEIMAVADVLGIRYRYQAYVERRPNRKNQGRVTFHTKHDCAAILLAVYPYLVTKQERAELMLRAITHRQKQPHPRKPDYIKAVDDAPFLERLGQMRALNLRGVPKGD